MFIVSKDGTCICPMNRPIRVEGKLILYDYNERFATTLGEYSTIIEAQQALADIINAKVREENVYFL